MNQKSINQIIETYIASSLHWPSVKMILRKAISVEEFTSSGFGLPRHWGPLLPIWCCEAAGGKGELAAVTAAAWKLFHTAAHILDNIADQDPPLEWWRNLGPGVAINTATALILIANGILLSQVEDQLENSFGRKIFNEFNRSLEITLSGQQLDLVHEEFETKMWFDIAAAKSGEPFALACKSGAIIAIDDKDRIDAFSKFGHRLGVIIQIQDDVQDFINEDLIVEENKKTRRFSLPISYALEVLPEKKQKHLRGLILSLPSDPDVKDEINELVEQSGAIVFIDTKISLIKKAAIESLNLAAYDNEYKILLINLLDDLSSI